MNREKLKLEIGLEKFKSNCSFGRQCLSTQSWGISLLEKSIREGDNPVHYLYGLESGRSRAHFLMMIEWALCHCFKESGCLRMQPQVGGKFHLKLNIGERPIANKYREGKMKRTLKRELKVLEIVKREPIEFSISVPSARIQFLNLEISLEN